MSEQPTNPTPDEVRASIVPRSDQLNADSLVTGPITVTVTAVKRGNKEQPITIELSGGLQPFKPCKTCRRILIAAWSDDPKQWIGQRMTLFCDPTVVYAGVRVGGIRISHLSGIDGTKTFLLTQTRGKKAEVVIQPITTTLDEQKFIDEVLAEITSATSEDTLQAIAGVLKGKPKHVCDAVRGEYARRLAELKAAKQVAQ